MAESASLAGAVERDEDAPRATPWWVRLVLVLVFHATVVLGQWWALAPNPGDLSTTPGLVPGLGTRQPVAHDGRAAARPRRAVGPHPSGRRPLPQLRDAAVPERGRDDVGRLPRQRCHPWPAPPERG